MAHVIAEAQNPEGRTVQLDSATWEHVLERHPEMAGSLQEMLSAVERPQYREPDLRSGRERYFRRSGRRDWVRVVTEFAGPTDRVVTAFREFNDPRERGPNE